MKTLQTISLFFAVFVLCQGCDDDDEYTPQPLPYFYCKINGQNFAARGAWQCQSRTFNYYPNGYLNFPQNSIAMTGVDCSTYDAVSLGLYGHTPSEVLLDLCDTARVDSCFTSFSTFSIGNAGVVFNTLVHGNVKFESFSDRAGDINGIVSGTFEFTVKNEEIDSLVVITEGRFQYIIDYEWY